jgi:hypothetical protein
MKVRECQSLQWLRPNGADCHAASRTAASTAIDGTGFWMKHLIRCLQIVLVVCYRKRPSPASRNAHDCEPYSWSFEIGRHDVEQCVGRRSSGMAIESERELNEAQMHVSGVPEASSPGSVEQINRRHLGVPNTAMVRYPRVATSIVPVPLCFQKSPPGRFVRYLGTVLLITSCLLLILGDIKNSTLIVWSDSI